MEQLSCKRLPEVVVDTDADSNPALAQLFCFADLLLHTFFALQNFAAHFFLLQIFFQGFVVASYIVGHVGLHFKWQHEFIIEK